MPNELVPHAGALNKRVGTYWTSRTKLDQTGLTLLDECVKNLAINKNWDPLARFISRAAALNSSDRSKVMGVIRAAFGDQIKYTKDASHASGGKITMTNNRQFADLQLLNSYGVVAVAIENSKGFRDADMHKELKSLRQPPNKPAISVEKAAKHLIEYMKTSKVPTGLVLAEVQKMLAANKVQAVVLDNNGEPNH